MNEEKNDTIKITKSLGESGLLIKGVSKTVNNEKKKKKGGFLSVSLGARLLGNLSRGKGTIRVVDKLVRIFNATSSFN